MRKSALLLAAPIVFLGVACGRGAPSTAKISDDLRRDLAAASSASLELASESQGYKPARFVSAIEQSEQAVPIQRRPVPRPVPHSHASPEPEQAKTPDAAPEQTVSVAQAPEPEQPAVSTDAPSVPIVAPRPAPVPVDYPSSDVGTRGRNGPGTGSGPDLGTIIGVVIRGGTVGDDHCVPRRRPGGTGLPRWPIRGTSFPQTTPPIVPGRVIPYIQRMSPRN